VSGWNTRTGCAQGRSICAVKPACTSLVDDFMAKALTARVSRAAENDARKSDGAGRKRRHQPDLGRCLPGIRVFRAADCHAWAGQACAAYGFLIRQFRPRRRARSTSASDAAELVAVPSVRARDEEEAVAVKEPPRYASRTGTPRPGSGGANGSARCARASAIRAWLPDAATFNSK